MALNDYSDDLLNKQELDDKGMISDKAIVESCAKIMTKEKNSTRSKKLYKKIMLTSKRHDEEPYIAGGINNFIKDSKPGDFISYSPADYSGKEMLLNSHLNLFILLFIFQKKLLISNSIFLLLS
jgi:hypothetical protein